LTPKEDATQLLRAQYITVVQEPDSGRADQAQFSIAFRSIFWQTISHVSVFQSRQF
jgi:hypothetical protein